MLNFTRPERPAPKEPDTKSAPRAVAPPTLTSPVPVSSANATPRPPVSTAPVPAPPRADGAERRLAIGVDINLKGVEISNCDVLVIEGNVDATVHSKAMEILAPGRLNGTATIDIAEIHGTFEGELTARTRLVVHGTGRVTGHDSLRIAGRGRGRLAHRRPDAARVGRTCGRSTGSGDVRTRRRDAGLTLAARPAAVGLCATPRRPRGLPLNPGRACRAPADERRLSSRNGRGSPGANAPRRRRPRRTRSTRSRAGRASRTTPRCAPPR